MFCSGGQFSVLGVNFLFWGSITFSGGQFSCSGGQFFCSGGQFSCAGGQFSCYKSLSINDLNRPYKSLKIRKLLERGCLENFKKFIVFFKTTIFVEDE